MELNNMNVKQLQELAAELGVKGRSKMKKAELVAAIEAAEAPVSDELFPSDNGLAEELEAAEEPLTQKQEADSEEQEEPVATEIVFSNITRDGASAKILFDNGDNRFAHVERFGHMLTIRERGFLTPSFKVKAVSFDRLARKWAKGLGVWNTEIKITKEI